MKKKNFFLSTTLAFALIGSTVFAGTYDDLITCDPCAPLMSCKQKESRLKVGGWIQATYFRNAWGSENEYVYDPSLDRNVIDGSTGNSDALGNVHSAEFSVNQIWGFVEREMDARHGFDWGFRADFAYGTDMWMSQAWNDRTFDDNWGEGDYYGSIPWLYGTVGYKNLKVKLGRTESLLGYESFTAPERRFVSASNAYYMEPLSQTGVMAQYDWKKLSFYAGWSVGNDTFENRFGDMAINGGVEWQITKKLNLSYMFTTGYEYDGQYADGTWRANHYLNMYDSSEMLGSRYDRYLHTLLLSWDFAKKWNYTLQSNFLQVRAADTYTLNINGQPYGLDGMTARSYGLVNYLYYTINDKWSLGFRFEWLRDEARVSGEFADFIGVGSGMHGTDMYELALALQWKPWENVILTGELRYDQTYLHGNGFSGYVGNAEGMKNRFDGSSRPEQFSGGISMVYVF